MIKFIPYGGLCNRLRAINSAIQLANDLKQPLEIIWMEDSGLNCAFKKLFEPINNINVKLIEKKSDLLLLSIFKWFWRRSKNAVVLDRLESINELTLTRLRKVEHVVILSCFQFYKTGTYNNFLPIAPLRDEIADRKMLLKPDSIGLHIRRNDHKFAINKSTDESFISLIEKEISVNPDISFYLASDSMNTKIEFMKMFPNNIIINNGQLSRNSEAGIKEALVELYTLASTRKIIGSYWSSYTETAGELGNKEIVFALE